MVVVVVVVGSKFVRVLLLLRLPLLLWHPLTDPMYVLGQALAAFCVFLPARRSP